MKRLAETLRAAARAGRARLASLQTSLFDALAAEPKAPPAPAEPFPAALQARAPAPGNLSASVIPALPSFDSQPGGAYSHVRVAVNPRLRGTWRVQWHRRREALHVQVPPRLAVAPEDIKEGLLQWAVLVSARSGRRDPARRALRAELETRIRAYLEAGEAEGPGARRRAARDRRRLERLNPKGSHHDLEGIFARVNAEYFAGNLQAKLTWSRRLGGLSTHSVARDGEGRPYHLISISRGYDNAEVTPEILGGVVYHECLHIAVPPRIERGRRVMHGPDFRAREREYRHYEAWRQWHRYELPKALRRLRRKESQK